MSGVLSENSNACVSGRKFRLRGPFLDLVQPPDLVVRALCAYDTEACALVRGVMVRAVSGFYERTAKRWGVPRPRAGAVAFVVLSENWNARISGNGCRLRGRFRVRVQPVLSENWNARISGNGCRLRGRFRVRVQPPELAVRAPVARQPQRNQRRSPSPDCRAGLNSPLVAVAADRS
jgi:hypothetical protein